MYSSSSPLVSAAEDLHDYEWESADDSPFDYDKKISASGLKSRNDINERIFMMEVEQAMRRRKLRKVDG